MTIYGVILRYFVLLLGIFSLTFTPLQSAHACPDVLGIVDPDCSGTIRVMFTGDSIVEGVGTNKLDSNGDHFGYPQIVERQVGSDKFVSLNLGVPGATPNSLKRAFIKNFDKGKITTKRSSNVDYVFIQVGTNAYWDNRRNPSQATPAQTATAIVRLIKYLRRALTLRNGYEPIIMTAQVPLTNRDFQNPYIRELNQQIFRLRKKLNLVTDFSKISFSRLNSPDDLHPGRYKPLAIKARKAIFNRTQSKARNLYSEDLDMDGVYDKTELSLFLTDPTIVDSDSDSLSDGDEVTIYKTSPNITDTDRDGISDGEEVTNGTDPLDATDPPAVEEEMEDPVVEE